MQLSEDELKNNKKRMLEIMGITEEQYEIEKKVRHQQMLDFCEVLRYAQEHSCNSKIKYEK